MDKKNIQDILILTPVQEGLLFHYLEPAGRSHYVEQLTLEIEGEMDPELVEKAWNRVIANNDILRTCFRWKKLDRPVQIILKKHTITLRYMEFDRREWKKERSDNERVFTAVKRRDREESFSLEEVPFRITLFRLDLCRYRLLVSSHHILYDGWSSSLLLGEFFTYYNAFLRKQEIEPVKRPSFKTFVRWLRGREPQAARMEEDYWTDYFRGIEPGSVSRLSIKAGGSGVPAVPGDVSTCCVNFAGLGSGVLTRERIKVFVSGHQVSPAVLFYVAWGLLLQRYNRSHDVVFGTAVSGRDIPLTGVEDMVGLLVNTLAFRFNTSRGETVVQMLTRCAQTMRDMAPFAHTPLVDVHRYAGMGGNREMFDTLMVVENYPLDPRSFQFSPRHPFAVSAGSLDESTHYDLTAGVLLLSHTAPVLTITYRTGQFSEACIRHLIDHFVFLLEDMIKNPWKESKAIEMLSPDEKRKILVEFNRTDAFYPSKTIHGMFHDQAVRTPDHTALVQFETPARKAGKGRNNITVTYEELNRRVKMLACRLAEQGAGPGKIIAVMVKRSVEMVITILGILESGAAYMPIDPGTPERRLNYLLADSSAHIMLTGTGLMNNSPTGPPHTRPCSHLYEEPAGEETAYVIYTSGTTGRPKGVMVKHRGAVNLLWSMQRIYPVDTGEGYLLKTPYFFDVSVAELFGWFMGGGRSVILAGGAEKEPGRILDTVQRFNVSHINFVPSMFSAFVQYLGDFPRRVAALRSLKMIFLAGEELPPGPVRTFLKLPLPRYVRLVNLYGPTEATVYTSWYSLAQWDDRGAVPIGTPLPNVRLYILGRAGGVQPVGIAGELGISGEGLAGGYLNRPELTAEKFVKLEKSRWYHPDSEAIKWSSFQLTLKSNSSHFTLYKTGDLARWRASGIIEFLGRIDEQIKVRGFRIEPGEIESETISHPLVRQAAAISRQCDSTGAELCLYVTVVHGVVDAETAEITDELKEYLRMRLPAYMIPSHTVIMDTMPLTPSGKIDRRVLPAPGISPGSQYQPPRSDVENMLVSTWNEILFPQKGEGAPPRGKGAPSRGMAIGIDDHFFHLGGHSLKALRMTGRIHKATGIELSLADVFEHPTVRQMAALLESRQNPGYLPVEPVEERGHYPLSLAQQRLFLWQMMETSGTAYNLPIVLHLEGADPGEKEKLERVLHQLVQRHECLRTSFSMHRSEPVQSISPPGLTGFAMEYYEVGTSLRHGEDLDLEVESVISSFVRPFDLSRGPLIRAAYIHRRDGREPLVVVDFHHLVTDGYSLGILAREFIQLYDGRLLPPLSLHYKDFILWERSERETRRIELQEFYWLSQFETGVPVLDIPLDFPRPPVQRFEGRVNVFQVSPGITAQLRRLAVSRKASLYLVLLAAYFVFLHKISGQEDIVVGTSAAGRRHNDLSGITGLFFHTLALRNYPRTHMTFRDFLEQVKQRFWDAFENQDYPFDRLVERLMERDVLHKDTSRNALFSTMFSWQNFDIPPLETGTLKMVPFPFEQRTSKFDLFPMAMDTGECVEIRLEYATSLFKPETVEKMIRWFTEVVEQVVEDPAVRLEDIRFTTHLIDAGTGKPENEFTQFNL